MMMNDAPTFAVYLNALAALFFVLGLIGGGAYCIKWWQQRGARTAPVIFAPGFQVLTSKTLDARHRLIKIADGHYAYSLLLSAGAPMLLEKQLIEQPAIGASNIHVFSPKKSTD
jgi:hypothetical protein